MKPSRVATVPAWFATLAATITMLLGVTAATVWHGGALAETPSPAATSHRLPGRFVAAHPLSDGRFNHTATLLADGDVLVAGGEYAPEILPTAQIYDPQTNAFSSTSALSVARKDHTATLLNDGEVLIAGGDDQVTVMSRAELFNPATGAFDFGGRMVVPRTLHTATLLSNGRVLIAGGSASVEQDGVFPLDTVEIFDPGKRKFSVGFFTMQTGRAMHTATALEHGRHQVLVVGGVNPFGGVEASAEIYDERTGVFASAGAMGSPRYGHTATLLKDGTVLITGGLDQNGRLLSTAEIYDRENSAAPFSPTGSMSHSRAFHTATLLKTGQVLIAGGSATAAQNPNYDQSAEIYTPGTTRGTGTFAATGTTAAPFIFMTATLLGSGKVLTDGGTQCCANPQVADPPPFPYFQAGPPPGVYYQAQVFDPKAGTFQPLPGGTGGQRAFHTATMLQDGRVLVVGGVDLRAGFRGAERYDSKSRVFSLTGVMNSVRAAHTASLINCTVSGCPDGEVLIAGGLGNVNMIEADLSSAELYDPSSGGTFTETGPLTTARDSATATALSDGRILIAGGEQIATQTNPAMVLDSAEIYDPITQAFSCVGGASGTPPACNSSMTSPRVLHSAVLLPDGTVLLAGGLDNNMKILSSAELFDPTANDGAGAFTALGPSMNQLQMNSPRVAHSATWLDPSTVAGPLAGKVLIAGGSFDRSAELYDPATGTFSCVGKSAGPPCDASMKAVRFLHTATLLGNGMVLLAGGSLLTARGQLFPESTAEVFDPAAGANGGFPFSGRMTTSRVLQTATLLNPKVVSGALAGDVLIVGGEQIDDTLMSAELFVPNHRR